jgi:hypothetical protein
MLGLRRVAERWEGSGGISMKYVEASGSIRPAEGPELLHEPIGREKTLPISASDLPFLT